MQNLMQQTTQQNVQNQQFMTSMLHFVHVMQKSLIRPNCNATTVMIGL
jgi:hypothetical protein